MRGDTVLRVPHARLADELVAYVRPLPQRILIATPTLPDGLEVLREVAQRAGARRLDPARYQVDLRGPVLHVVAESAPGSAVGMNADLVMAADELTNPTFLADLEAALDAVPRFAGVRPAAELLGERNGTAAS